MSESTVRYNSEPEVSFSILPQVGNAPPCLLSVVGLLDSQDDAISRDQNAWDSYCKGNDVTVRELDGIGRRGLSWWGAWEVWIIYGDSQEYSICRLCVERVSDNLDVEVRIKNNNM